MDIIPTHSTEEEDCDLPPEISDHHNSYFAPDTILGYTWDDICLFLNSLTTNGMICHKKP
jgi:hypothetical protein